MSNSPQYPLSAQRALGDEKAHRARLEDSQCAGLRSRGPLRTVEDHFHKIKVGDEVKRPIWKLAHPAELAIHAYDPANLHRVWDARIQLVKDGSGVTEPRINTGVLGTAVLVTSYRAAIVAVRAPRYVRQALFGNGLTA